MGRLSRDSTFTLTLTANEAAWLNWRLLASDRDHPTAMRIRDEIRAEYPVLPSLPPVYPA